MNNIHDFLRMKQAGEKITMVTCYDYASAIILEESGVDCVLVGDSVSMVMHGYPNTTYATLEMMMLHTSAVARGFKNTFIVSDLPFLSYRKSLPITMDAVQQLIQAGAHAVKLEGAVGNLETIVHIVQSGVPVMGHIGLTPQHIHQLGGYKVQGKGKELAEALVQQAKDCEVAGCFSIVLECVPFMLAQKITESVSIPTIGIGAGAKTDGQVLVYQDLLGLQTEIIPKFVKQYCDGKGILSNHVKEYVSEVKAGSFPLEVHGFEDC